MKILVTGAGGQLGTALTRILGGHEVTATAHGTLDITDLAAVRKIVGKGRFDWVVNAAAYNQVDRAEEDRRTAFAVNAEGPKNLAVASAEAGIPVLHVSTDYVFDGMAGRPYTEEDEPNPRSAYGESKLAGEKEVAAANPRHMIVRTAWLYGETGNNFPKTMLRLAAKGDVRVVNDQFGSPTYAPHLAEGITKLMQTDAWGIYHMAGSGKASWHGLTVALFRLLGITVKVTPIAGSEFPRPAQRPPFSVLETRRRPAVVLPPWEKGLEMFAANMKKQMEIKS